MAVLAVGYVLAHLVFDRLRTRFGYAGGAEYVVLGFLLGPKVSGLMSDTVVRSLTPIASLAMGWLGMALGTYFRLPELVGRMQGLVSIAFTEAITVVAVASGLLFAVLHGLVGLDVTTASILAITLGSIATLSAPAAIDAFANQGRRAKHRLFPALQFTARIDGVVGIAVFGLALAIFHQGRVAPVIRPPTATEWAVINVAVGVVSGVLFHLFLGPHEHTQTPAGRSQLFVALAAVIVVASGASYYLNLSPVFTTLILGFVLVNTGRAHEDVRQFLASTERPIYLALLVLAGATWTAPTFGLLFIAPMFVGARLLGRWAGGWLAGRWVAAPRMRARGMGRALLAQGATGVAIALNYGQVFPTLRPNLVLTSALLSVLLFEGVAAAETARFLDAGTAAAGPDAEYDGATTESAA